MSANSAEDRIFQQIIDGSFNDIEQQELACGGCASRSYYTESLGTTTDVMLDTFLSLLSHHLLDDPVLLQQAVQRALIHEVGLRHGETVLISDAELFVDKNGPGIIPTSFEVRGVFRGFLPDDLLAIDGVDAVEEPTIKSVIGHMGLYAALADVVIADAAGDVLGIPAAHVSLSNGRPSMKQIFYTN